MEIQLNESKHGGDSTVYWKSLTMREFLNAVETPVDISFIPEHERASLEKGNEPWIRGNDGPRATWFGNVTLAQAMQMASSGWPEGAKKVQELSATISAPLLKQIEKVVHFDVAPGEWIDPDKLISGQPEVWGEIVEGEEMVDSARGKFVHIVVNAGMSCSQCNSMNCMTEPVSPSTLLNRGAMLASFIDVLDALGFRTKLSLVCCIQDAGATSPGMKVGEKKKMIWEIPKSETFTHNGDKIAISVSLKDYHDHLDMDGLIYALGHPSMMRRLMFCYLEHLSPTMKAKFRLYSEGAAVGTYGNITNHVPKELNLSVGDSDEVVYLPSMSGNPPDYLSMEAAKNQCHILLQKQGVRMNWNAE